MHWHSQLSVSRTSNSPHSVMRHAHSQVDSSCTSFSLQREVGHPHSQSIGFLSCPGSHWERDSGQAHVQLESSSSPRGHDVIGIHSQLHEVSKDNIGGQGESTLQSHEQDSGSRVTPSAHSRVQSH